MTIVRPAAAARFTAALTIFAPTLAGGQTASTFGADLVNDFTQRR